MLWMERYSPRKLGELTYNPKVTELLSVLSKTQDFPHLLLHGPNGAGKRTRIRAFLQAIYGDKALHVKGETREFKKTSGTVECVIVSSAFHFEVTPSDAGIYDRLVVQQLIKDVASSHTLGIDIKDEDNGGEPTLNEPLFRIIVIHQADRLTHEA